MEQKLYNYLKRSLEFPREIHLESSHFCNLHCIMCPRKYKVEKSQYLSRELFDKAVNETSAYEMDYIHFHLNGESLFMDISELINRINYARHKNPKTKQLCMFTNGTLLSSRIIDKILDSKLDIIKISVNAGNSESYKKMTGHDVWDLLIDNIKNLCKRRNELGSKLFIETGFIPTIFNKDSLEDYYKLMKDLGVDLAGGGGINNIGGQINADSLKLPEQYISGNINAPCLRLFMDLSIMYNGEACVCSQDVNGDYIVGDLNKQTLKQIWQGDLLRKIRTKFIFNNKKYIHYCANCDYMLGCVAPDFWNVPRETFENIYLEVLDEIY